MKRLLLFCLVMVTVGSWAATFPQQFTTNAAGIRFSGSVLTNVPPTSSPYHQFDLVQDFGAIPDGVSLFNVTNATGSTTIKVGGAIKMFGGVGGYYTNTTSVFLAGRDEGKVISLYKMGSLTNNYTATISTVVDANTITVPTAPPMGASNTFGVFGTDNTTPIQNALNIVSNWSATIWFPDGIYVVNGATNASNGSQLYVPPINASSNGMALRVIRLKANHGSLQRQASQNAQAYMDASGAMIWSTCTNLGGWTNSVLDCQNNINPVFNYSYSGDTGNKTVNFNQIRFENDGVSWRSCWDNNGTTLGLCGAANIDLRNCRIDNGYMLYNNPQPFWTNTLMVSLPPSFSAGGSIIDEVQIGGGYRAITHGEHIYARNLEIDSSMIGVDYEFFPAGGGHEGQWLVDFEACRTNMYARALPMVVDMICTSETPFNTDWSFTGHQDIYDGLGALTGRLIFNNTTDGTFKSVGSLKLLVVNLPNLSQGFVTNSYDYSTLGHWDSGTLGTTATGSPIQLYSSDGFSLVLQNNFNNQILYYADNLTKSWRTGVPGTGVGNAVYYDYYLASFKDIITDGSKPAFVLHYDNDTLDLRSNLFVGFNILATNGSFVGNESQLTNVITSQSANYNIAANDSVVLLNGNLTATLPTAVGIPGKRYTIICKTSGTNGILTTSSQTISGPLNVLGALKWTNSAAGRSTTVMSDNANWWVLKTDN